jgi:hypothetical protein
LFGGVGTHPAPNVVVVTLREKVAIHFPHPFLTEGKGIVLFMGNASPVNPQPVAPAWLLGHHLFK